MCVYFGGDMVWDQFQNFEIDVYCQFIGSIEDLLCVIVVLVMSSGDSVVNQFMVFRDLSCVENQGRVSGGILRLIQFYCCNIFGVSDDSGVLMQRS